LLGCERESTPSPSTVVKSAPNARTLLKSNLVISCAHVVVEPDLISGVLTARNIGKGPPAVVDRWNSWGAHQWRLAVGDQTAVNPKTNWWANFYTETVLAPGEIRHARFYITRSTSRARVGQEAWWFLVGGPFGEISLATSESAGAPAPSFSGGQPVTFFMDGAQKDAPDTDRDLTAALWCGGVTVRSEELTSVRDLEDRIQGKLLR